MNRTSTIYRIDAAGMENLTLRDIRALQSADQIIFESDIDARILEFGRREAKRISVCSVSPEMGSLLCLPNTVLIGCEPGGT